MSETAKMERAQTRETLPRVEDPIMLFQEWSRTQSIPA